MAQNSGWRRLQQPLYLLVRLSLQCVYGGDGTDTGSRRKRGARATIVEPGTWVWPDRVVHPRTEGDASQRGFKARHEGNGTLKNRIKSTRTRLQVSDNNPLAETIIDRPHLRWHVSVTYSKYEYVRTSLPLATSIFFYFWHASRDVNENGGFHP